MSQNDLVIASQSFPATRSDINSALQALGSLNSGSSAPATTYANMLWYDTATNTLKMRAEANDAWISVGYLDQGADAFRIFDDTQVVNSSGTQTGLIGDQATSAWEAGTSTTESLVSPAKIKAAIDALASSVPADGSITEAKLASSAVSRVKLKTGTNSAAYNFGENGGAIQVTLDAYSFFPSMSGTNASGLINGGTGAADSPSIRISASGNASGTLAWRYIEA
jgi:hypothetical protein